MGLVTYLSIGLAVVVATRIYIAARGLTIEGEHWWHAITGVLLWPLALVKLFGPAIREVFRRR